MRKPSKILFRPLTNQVKTSHFNLLKRDLLNTTNRLSRTYRHSQFKTSYFKSKFIFFIFTEGCPNDMVTCIHGECMHSVYACDKSTHCIAESQCLPGIIYNKNDQLLELEEQLYYIVLLIFNS